MFFPFHANQSEMRCETEEAHEMSLTKRHDMDLAARVVPNPSVERNRANLLLSVCAYRNHRPCSKDRARGNDHEYDCAFQSMVGIEVMESTCEANDTKGPSGSAPIHPANAGSCPSRQRCFAPSASRSAETKGTSRLVLRTQAGCKEKETFPEARLKVASGGPQSGHHRRYAYVSPFRLK
jgi:hypothetical protein